MPRVGGDGSVGGKSIEKSGVAGIGGWFGEATRVMSEGTGGGYVLLGGTRYGLRLSQVRIYPTNCILIINKFIVKYHK